jgi:hypothetical protein
MLALVARARAPLFIRAAATSAADTPAKVPLFSKYSNTDANLANVGVKWTETEIQELVSRIAANEPLEAVALKHKRTVKSIQARLAALANAAIVADPASQAKVLAKYHVTVQDIEELNRQNAERKGKSKAAPKSSAPKAASAGPAAATTAAAATPLPAMVGKPWTPEHNDELMKQAAARKSIADISALLARTPRSVEMRIAHLSLEKGMTKVRPDRTDLQQHLHSPANCIGHSSFVFHSAHTRRTPPVAHPPLGRCSPAVRRFGRVLRPRRCAAAGQGRQGAGQARCLGAQLMYACNVASVVVSRHVTLLL